MTFLKSSTQVVLTWQTYRERQLITPDGQDVYDVIYYGGYHKFIHVRKTGMFEGTHNRRLNDINQARMWVDEIAEEVKAMCY